MAGVNLTINMDDYLYDMRVAGVFHTFNDWLRAEGIDKMLCFEMTFAAGESACLELTCYAAGKFRSKSVSVMRQYTPAMPPPPEVMHWLLTR